MAKSTELVGFEDKLPAEYVDFGEDAGRGLEGASRNELLTPFVGVVHYSCPQIMEGDPKYIEGARPGMLFNTATKQLSDGKKGISFVPVSREHLYTEWVPRDAGGGFRGVRSITDPMVAALKKEQGGFKRLITPDNTELVEQFNLYFLYNPDGEDITADNAQEAVMAFTSTKIQGYKAMFTIASAIRYPGPNNSMITPPLFAHRWHLNTVPKKNDEGPFFVYDIHLVDPTPTVTRPVNSLIRMNDALYQRARAFNELLREGGAAADYASQEAGSSDGGLDDNIPF